MKRQIRNYSAVLVLLLCISSKTLGCIMPAVPITKFKPSEYVFIGRVVGIVGPISQLYQGEAWGLMVSVEEPIHLPKSPERHFEVFPFGISSFCSTVPVSRETLSKNYPTGSQVRIIAQEFLSGDATGSHTIRLRASTYLGLALNTLHGKPMTDSSSLFDYKAYKQNDAPSPVAEPGMYDSHMLWPHFEARKDLLRLARAHNDEERATVLKRFLYYSGTDYNVLLSNYIKDKQLLKQLKKQAKAYWGKTKRNYAHVST